MGACPELVEGPFGMPFQGARPLYLPSEGVALGYYGVAFQAVADP